MGGLGSPVLGSGATFSQAHPEIAQEQGTGTRSR